MTNHSPDSVHDPIHGSASGEVALEDYPSPDEKDAPTNKPFEVVEVLGLPVAKLTFEQTVNEVDRLIEARRPGFFITANLHYAMLTAADPALDALNRRAHFIVADGAPLVRESETIGNPLPQRVTGSDLIFALCKRAAEKGHRVYLLGGMPGVAEAAAEVLCQKYPGLTIAGIAAPDFRTMADHDHELLVREIRDTCPDILFAALGQPKGEFWIDKYAEALGIPVTAQVGASFDFVAGKVKRAPTWIQHIGLEWVYRISREPFRMIPRYWANGFFLLKWRFTRKTKSKQ